MDAPWTGFAILAVVVVVAGLLRWWESWLDDKRDQEE